MKKVGYVGVLTALLIVSLAGTASAQWNGESEDSLRRDADRHRSQSKCGDFWVSYAFMRSTVGGYADPAACDIRNYNGGRWNSLSELLDLMDCYMGGGRRPCSLVEYSYRASRQPNGNVRLETLANGRAIGYIDVDGANRMVAAGGGNLIGNDGGSMVAAGGGNIIGNDAGSMVAAGGGNLIARARAARTLQSVLEEPVGRGLFRYGAAVRGKDAPTLDLTVKKDAEAKPLKLRLVGAPSEDVTPTAPAEKKQ